MSTLTYSNVLFSPRRHAVRFFQHTTGQHPSVSVSADSVALTALPSQAVNINRRNQSSLIIASVILLTHLTGAWYIHTHPSEKIQAADTPPISVELYKPLIEPPKPLPQKKEQHPVQVKKQIPQLPTVKLPEPPPRPISSEPIANTKPAVEAPAAPDPAPVAPPSVAEPIIQASAKASYLHNPPPTYPDFAQEQGWEGQVILKVHVQANGKPSTVQIKRSSGRKMLDESALQAVQRWSFVPAKQGQTAIDGWVDVPIDFKISS